MGKNFSLQFLSTNSLKSYSPRFRPKSVSNYPIIVPKYYLAFQETARHRKNPLITLQQSGNYEKPGKQGIA